MDKIIVNFINHAGINFTSDSKQEYEKRKVYNLNLKSENIEVNLKIAIIETAIDDSGNWSYRALYRELTDEQIKSLRQLANSEPFKTTKTLSATFTG